MWPWQPASAHLAAMVLSGMILAELLLLKFRKIPFNCSYLPGKSNLIVILVALALMGFSAVIDGLNYELYALTRDHRSLFRRLATVAAAALALRFYAWWRTRSEADTIEFEDIPDPAVMVLGLNRDGSAVRG